MSRMLATTAAATCLALGCQQQAPAPPAAPEVRSAVVSDEPPKAPDPEPESPRAEGACASGAACSREATVALRRGDTDTAVASHDRACGMGHASSCFQLGRMYRDGKGVAASEGRARELLEQACRLGSQEACDALGH